MLMQNPQLAYALLQAQVVMRIVDPVTAAVSCTKPIMDDKKTYSKYNRPCFIRQIQFRNQSCQLISLQLRFNPARSFLPSTEQDRISPLELLIHGHQVGELMFKGHHHRVQVLQEVIIYF